MLAKIVTKQRWKKRLYQIKSFIRKNLSRDGTNGENYLRLYFKNEYNQIFNLILALYAGENKELIFKDLDGLYEEYPEDLEFYIP